MELTVQQKRALAVAQARVRARQKAPPAQQHPELDGSNIAGYNPKTGLVEPDYGTTGSAAMGAADAASFGFGDELASLAGSAITGVPRERVLAEMRGNQKAAQEQNPKSYLAGQIGGGVAQAAVSGPGVLASAPTLAGKFIGGGITGGGMGAVYGAGSGEDSDSRVWEALKNGAIGTVAGGVFPVVAKGAASGYRMVADALKGRAVAKEAGTSPEVLRMLGNTLDADGTRGPTGRANMAKAGSEAMLADAGPNAKAVLDTAIQRGGPGSVAAREAIAARTTRASESVTGAMDSALGAPEGITTARSAIRKGSANARSAAYDDAYGMPINYADPRGQALENIIKSRVPQSAINEANALMRAEGNHSKQILAKVADDGTVSFETLPDVRQLDYITRGLNEVADQADGAGKLGGTTAKGRAYTNLSKEIRDNLRALVPEYGTALETAADPIRRSKAVDLGSQLLSPAMTRDQAKEAVAGMTGAERAALGQGIRSRLDDLMANVTRTVQDGDTTAREAVKAIKDLSSRANREKLEIAIGKAKADALFEEIDRAATSFDLRASVAENSKTYARQAIDRKVKDMTSPGAVGELMEGRPVKAGQRVIQALTGRTPEKKLADQDKVYSDVAKALTRGQGEGKALFDAIDRLGQSDARTMVRGDQIARALSARHAYPTTILLEDRLRSRQGR